MPCVILHILQYFHPAELLQTLLVTCKLWKSVAESEELWSHILTSYGLSSHLPTSKDSFKDLFAAFIPVVNNTNILKFAINDATWTQIPLSNPLKLGYFVSISRLCAGQLFLTGAPLPHDTLQIHHFTGNIEFLENLPVHRNNIGLIRYSSHIYAFGGYDGLYLSTCDRYQAGLGWERLPDMSTPRATFNPTVHKGLIYLLGGWSSGECEVFDTVTTSFSLIPSLNLPPNTFLISWWTANTLTCLEKTGIYRYSATKPPTWQVTKQGFDLGIVPWSSFKVSLHGNFLYLVEMFAGKIVVMDSRTLEMRDLQIPTGSNK